jgi:hypothetical protein
MEKPTFTVVACTKDRSEALSRCLVSVAPLAG